MKIILTFLLALMASQSIASPAKVFALVCGHKYTEGIRKERPNGQVVLECLNKRSLPGVYEADIRSSCHNTHVEGAWHFSSNGFHYKECIERKQLDEVHMTYYLNSCEAGYKSDKVESFYDYEFPYVVCVKN